MPPKGGSERSELTPCINYFLLFNSQVITITIDEESPKGKGPQKTYSNTCKVSITTCTVYVCTEVTANC